MKKIVLTIVACVAFWGVSAQTDAHRAISHPASVEDIAVANTRNSENRISTIERMAAKNNYTQKLVGYRTSDYYEFQHYSYDADHKLIAVKDSVRNEYSVIDSLAYNDQGQMIKLSGWQLMSNGWKNVYYIDYTYDAAGNIASRTNYNMFDGEWNLGGVYEYTYNQNNQITLTTLTMTGRVFQKIEYTYVDGLMTQELWYNFDGMGLSPSEKICSSYENGLKTLELDSTAASNGGWEYYGRRTYMYDEYGNCVEYHYYDQTRGEAERSIYSYDYDMPLSQTLMPWDPEMIRPVTYNNAHAYYSEAWYTVDVEHVLQYVCDYIYEYADINLGINDLTSENFSVYPNPASDVVVVEGLPEAPVKLQVIDAMGRVAAEYQVSAADNHVNLSALSAGCYILRVASPNDVRTMKVVVE